MALAASLSYADPPENYQSVWQQLFPETLEPRGVEPSPMVKSFHEAAACKNLTQANEKWKAFTEEFAPEEEGQYEDAMHARYMKWAAKELKRTKLLLEKKPQEALKVEDALKKMAAEEEGKAVANPLKSL